MMAILLALAMAATDTQPELVARLDFGSGPVADGWESVADTDARWVLPWGDGNGYRDRGRGNDLLRDGFSAPSQVLSLPVPNGDYRAVIHVGDAQYGHDLMVVSVTDAADTVTTQRGEHTTVTLETTVANGLLQVAFRDGGGVDPNVFVTAVEVYSLAVSIEPPTTPPTTQPDRCGAVGVMEFGIVRIIVTCQRPKGHETMPDIDAAEWHEWWSPNDVQVVWQGDDTSALTPLVTTTRPVAVTVQP